MAVISWNDHVAAATITDSTAEGSAALSKEKLKTRQLGDIYRRDLTGLSPIGGTLLLDFDLGSAKTTNLVGILGHNLGGMGYEVHFGTSLGGAQVATEGPYTFWQGTADDAANELLWLTTARSARYVRLEVDLTGQEQVADIGRVWLDDAWEFSLALEFGIGIDDPAGRPTKSKGQSAYVTARKRARVLDCLARGLTTDDALGNASDPLLQSFLTMDLAVGSSGEIILLPSVASQLKRQRMGVYGSISQNTPMRFLDNGEGEFFTEKRFTVEEEF